MNYGDSLRHKSYLTLPSVTSLRDPFCLSNALELAPKCLLEHNAFSVLHYVIKVILHYLTLHRFETHSALELSRACSLENNALSVLHHVIKVTLHYLLLRRFETHSALELSRACSLENNAFSVLHYVIKVTLHYLTLHRFEIHSALELSRTALLCCPLARLLVGNKQAQLCGK